MPRRGGLPLQEINQTGFLGMRDQRSPTMKPGELLYCLNLFPEALDRPSALQLRPGFKRWSASGNALQLGAGAASRKVVWSGFCRFAAKNVLVIVNTDGVFSLVGNGVYTVTTELTNAQVVGAGANLAGVTGAVFFRQKLIVTTASGKPWTWDGTTGGGISVIAGAASGYDLPTVYVAKVFFRKGSSGTNARTIVWSEENDETIGYETAPYSNVWELSQTSQQPINDLVATEGQIVVLRPSSIGSIEGEVDANFKTTATRNSVSDVVGGTAGFAAQQFRGYVTVGGAVMFFDNQSRPSLYRPGRGLQPLWRQLPRVFNKQGPPGFDDEPWDLDGLLGVSELLGDVTPLIAGIGLYFDPQRRCNVFVMHGTAAGPIGWAYLFYFDAETDRLVAVWRTTLASSSCCILSTGEAFTAYSTVHAIKVEANGDLYFQDEDNQKSGSQWRDETLTTTGSTYPGLIVTGPLAWKARGDWHWEQIIAVTERRPQNTLTAAYLTSTLPRGVLAVSAGATAQTDAIAGAGNTPYEERVQIGIDGLGRWLMLCLSLTPNVSTADTDRLAILGYSVLGRQLPTPVVGWR
jgi:hypothetical protein